MRYILVGNPNVGKTTCFNLLTDSNDKVTNFTGTTIDVIERNIKGSNDTLLDIPGIRSLIHDAEDERVATQAILTGNFNKIINILDATNLRRNLYLTIQLLESGHPMSCILNMKDEAEKRNMKINTAAFEQFFCQLHYTSVRKESDATVLTQFLKKQGTHAFRLDYGSQLEQAIRKLEQILSEESIHDVHATNSRFLALQLLANNIFILENVSDTARQKIEEVMNRVEKEICDSGEARSIQGLLFKVRRAYIQSAMDAIVTHTKENSVSLQSNDIFMNKYIGIPLFLLIFYLVFYLTFRIGDPVADALDQFLLVPFGDLLTSFLNFISLPEVLVRLIIDGAYAGVSTVITFLPHILLVFIFLSLLEGSGYMSRAVVLFDQSLSRIGLNGKALAPMMIGFGCNVPAIMATRTISDKKERLITQLIIPFISCAARLEIYVLFIGIFFDRHEALILMGINALGVLIALVSAKIFSLSFFKSNQSFFLVEIPPYRTISFEYIYKITINKVKQFFLRAGKYIVLGSVIIFILFNFGPSGYTKDVTQSFYALFGHVFAPLFAPLGFGTWEATSSLISGFLAKELVVAHIGILVSDYATVEQGVQTLFTWQSALSFMVFNLLYIPCLSTLATLRIETKSIFFSIFSVLYSFVTAYLVSLIIYWTLIWLT